MTPTTKREVRPPDIAGYTYRELIGQGGFADVFCYQEHHPTRDVAVKVLTDTEVASEGRRQFDAEAELMAQVAHPSIVQIHKADVSPDGRPYLVMELCSGPSLAVRYRNEQIPVPEVLEIGIRISAAVETAHRAGILHRDVKPHNILTNAYGQPKLSDFGIAVVSGESREQTGSGLSIPWSPPEMFEEEPPEDVRSDVYSLAATVYTLVAGRSPFEVPGGANDSHTLINRIERQPVSRLTRADVPDLLNDVLDRAMGKRIDDRHPSAMAFARALQEVQISLHMAPTRIDVLDASPERPAVESDDGRTRVRPIAVIVPDALLDATSLRPLPTPPAEPVAGPASDQTYRKRPTPAQLAQVEPAVPDTMERLPNADVPAEVEADAAPARRGRWVVWAGALLALAVVVVLLIGQLLGSTPPSTKPSSLEPEGENDAVVPDAGVPTVTGLVGVRRAGKVTYSWKNPAPKEGDFYTWVRIDDETAPHEPVRATKLSFAPKAGTQGCVQVTLVRENGQASPPSAPACPGSTP